MKQTTNYSFNKPELADSPPDITVLNPNFDKIDAQLKSLTDKDTELNTAINNLKNDYLPKTGGNITNALTVKNKTVAVSVNGSTADANGNITIDVGGKVQSINGVKPDSSGNVTIEFGGGDVQSVDGVEPDSNGNVGLNASTREEILEGAKRVTDVEVDASVATHEALQTAVARIESNFDNCLVNGYKANGKTVSLNSGSEWNVGGASMHLKPCIDGDSSNLGQFNLTASNGSTSMTLLGQPDGTLKWGAKEVERVNAMSMGYYDGYIRYENGLQMCWGKIESTTANADTTVTFPVAFSKGEQVNISRVSSASATGGVYCWMRSVTTTSFKVFTKEATGIRWIAVGWWK